MIPYRSAEGWDVTPGAGSTMTQDMTLDPPAPGRQEQRKAQTRAAILAAAAELFRSKGYHDTSTREIAALADLGEGTMYGHFASKDDILLELVRERAREATQRTVARLEQCHGRLERLRIMLRAMAEFCDDERHLLVPSLVLRRAQRQREDAPRREPLVVPVMDTLTAGINAGEFALVPVETAARALVALYQNASFQIGPWAGHFERDRTLDELDAVLAAWLIAPQPPRDTGVDAQA
jgi:AcrR family transcriptional regulator